jgi:hypothetical protein
MLGGRTISVGSLLVMRALSRRELELEFLVAETLASA